MRINAMAIPISLVFRMLKPYLSISFPSANATANLANSAGCTLTDEPIGNQEREPFVSGAMKMVTSSNSIIAK